MGKKVGRHSVVLSHPSPKMSEDQLRQRKGQKEKEAMRSRLEEMRRKMKDTEQRQERWDSLMSCVKPVAVVVLGIVALYLLYLYITNTYFSPTQPLQPNRHHNVEHMIMKDSDIEDM